MFFLHIKKSNLSWSGWPSFRFVHLTHSMLTLLCLQLDLIFLLASFMLTYTALKMIQRFVRILVKIIIQTFEAKKAFINFQFRKRWWKALSEIMDCRLDKKKTYTWFLNKNELWSPLKMFCSKNISALNSLFKLEDSENSYCPSKILFDDF